MTSPLIETTRGWELPVQGWKVTRCFLDPAAFGFLVDGGTGDTLRLYVEGEFTLGRASGAATFGTSGQDPIDYAPLLSLMGVAVAGVEISSDGNLRIAFENGDEIQVAPDPDYEAWELEGLGRLMVVCTPGGGEPSIFND
jgi:hypothetical protein